MPQRRKWALKIFTSVVYNLLLPVWMHLYGLHCRWTHFHLSNPWDEGSGSCFNALLTCGATWQVSIYSRVRAISFQISWQPSFPCWMALLCLVGPFLMARLSGPHSMQSGMSCRLSFQAWDLTFSWTVTSRVMWESQGMTLFRWEDARGVMVSIIPTTPGSWDRDKEQRAGHTRSWDTGDAAAQAAGWAVR